MHAHIERIKTILATHRSALLNLPNVTSVGIGFKNGIEDEDHLAIVVTVTAKIDRRRLESHELVPPVIEDVPTDVIESGPFQALSDSEGD